MKAGAWFVLAAILAIWLSVKIRRRRGARVRSGWAKAFKKQTDRYVVDKHDAQG